MASERLSEKLVERAKRVQRKTKEPSTRVGPQHPLITLQRQVGNAAVDRLLRQEAGQDSDVMQRMEEEEEMLQPSHDLSLQREEEEEEMLQPSHDLSLQRMEEEEEMLQPSHDLSLQRQEEEEEIMPSHDLSLQREGEEEEMLQPSRDSGLAQAEVGLEGGAVGAQFEQMLSSSRGGGSPVQDGVRDRMESALGTELGAVRVHRDAESDSMTRNVTSSAFTTGNDIYLRGDQNPSDSSLMSHELTHVVQQRSMSGGGGGVQVGAAGDAHEREADEVSKFVNSHTPEIEPDA